ncbi:MAG TPA: VWA domain-containing protein [Bryobacteraceae bacterium]|nr:VWA domain-containing protein [Bryobacteraceae bacterium]
MLVGLAVAGAALLYAQQHDAPAVFHSDTRVVVCHTTVVDRSGRLVDHLTQDAFTVFENNVRQQIKVFKHEDIPVSMGLVIDSSGSMRNSNKRAGVEAAAMALIQASNPGDEVFVIHFNDETYFDNPHGKEFLTKPEEMREALGRTDPSGGTAMRDAVQLAIGWMKKAHKEKKVLVVVTDGEDNASSEDNTLENVVRSARQNEVLIYSVGLLTEEDHKAAANAKHQLNELSEATGGEAFFPKEVSEVDPIARQVARDLRSQYTIEYTPSNPTMDGSFRRIRVSVKGPGGPTARTRTGYYATPDQVAGSDAAPAANLRR